MTGTGPVSSRARRLAAAAVGLLFLTACTGEPRVGETVIRRTTPPILASPAPLSEQMQANLAGGAYVADRFEPPFTFRVGQGWGAYVHLPAFVFLSLGEPNLRRPKALSFQTLHRVVEPKASNLFTGKLLPPPQDLAGWLQHHPFIEAGAATVTTVGGKQAIQVDGVVKATPKRYGGPGVEDAGCPAPCVVLWTTEPQGSSFVFFVKGERVRFIMLRVGDQEVVITVEAMAGEFDQVVAESERVLGSVRFES
ncbi:MAG TPA: hypothetical protein VHH54_04550 [Actinomycetota bacterium]|nr:hypothetical protein [Actinomycetota bacterium]